LDPQTEYTVTVAQSALSADGENLPFDVTASWITDRVPPDFGPLPPSAGTLRPLEANISVDGNASDWPATAALARNQHHFDFDGFYVWNDAIGDDTGAGNYSYPTNEVFTEGDADIDRFAMAYDENNLYFLVEQASINPGASFYTSYFAIALDTGLPGRVDLGLDLGTEATGVAELYVRQDADVDFEIALTGTNGGLLVGPDGDALMDLAVAFSQQSGIMEVAVPRNLLGLSGELDQQPLNVYVYSALETFGSMREVGTNKGTWEPGGGVAGTIDPDIFDLAGAGQAAQETDLNQFDQFFESTVGSSLLPLTLSETDNNAGVEQFWILY